MLGDKFISGNEVRRELIEKYSTVLPEELIEMWKQYGFCSLIIFWVAIFISAWQNLTRSDTWPTQSEGSKRLIQIYIITLLAATRNRLRKNWIRASSTSPCWRRNPMLQNIII